MQSSEQGERRKVLRRSVWLVAGIVVALSVTGCGGADDSLAQRLQAVEDRDEIQQLIAGDYSTAIDTRDAKAFTSLFTEDGEFNLYATQFPPKEFKGRAAIEKMVSTPPPPGDGAGAPPDMPASMKHVITNPHIQINGDQATATTYWQEVSIGKDGKVSAPSTGYYRDVLKRDQGRWRFKKREVFNYDMPVAAAHDASTSTSN